MTPPEPQTPSSAPLPPDLQQRLDQHLDAVDDTLRRDGMARSERAAITDELANQAADMLDQRAGDREPTAENLAAVLDELDPPASYAQTDPPPTPSPPKPGASRSDAPGSPHNSATAPWHPLAVTAFIWALSMVVFPFAGFAGLIALPLLLIAATAPVGSPILGFIAINDLKAKRRQQRPHQRGMAMAVFTAIFGPVLMFITITTALLVGGVLFGSYASAANSARAAATLQQQRTQQALQDSNDSSHTNTHADGTTILTNKWDEHGQQKTLTTATPEVIALQTMPVVRDSWAISILGLLMVGFAIATVPSVFYGRWVYRYAYDIPRKKQRRKTAAKPPQPQTP